MGARKLTGRNGHGTDVTIDHAPSCRLGARRMKVVPVGLMGAVIRDWEGLHSSPARSCHMGAIKSLVDVVRAAIVTESKARP